MKPSQYTAANGHLTLDFEDLPDHYWETVVHRLEATGNLKRVGPEVEGPGQLIFQSFEGPAFCLSAGWDNWSGYYLLADSHAGDEFLQNLFLELSAEDSISKGSTP